jgi:uncharacterized protein YndB with AHSA1/START domain
VARNVIEIDAPPERVWEVLSDPRCYPRWVVGAKEFRDADPDFPAIGSKFHHRVGVGPLTLADHTEVVDVNPPWRIELKAKARPLGAANVVLQAEPSGSGTRLTMIEDPADPITRLLAIVHLVVRVRNARGLQRLKAIAERPVRRGARAAAAGR